MLREREKKKRREGEKGRNDEEMSGTSVADGTAIDPPPAPSTAKPSKLMSRRLTQLADANDKFVKGVHVTANKNLVPLCKKMTKVNTSLHKLSDLVRHTSRSTRIVNAELTDFSVKLLQHATDHNDLLPCFSSLANDGRKFTGSTPGKSIGFVQWQHLTKSKEYRKDLYEQYLSLKDFDTNKHIVQDLPRTFGDVPPYKQGAGDVGSSAIHQSLRNVLHAYALHDPQVGYVQGMNLIAGFLLACSAESLGKLKQGQKNGKGDENRKARVDERQTFWVFARLMKMPKYNLRQFFLPNMPRLMVMAYQMDMLMSEWTGKNQQELFEHFKRLDIDTKTWFATWALTLFSSTMPWHMLRQAWGFIFQKGVNIGVVSITMAILQTSTQRLLLCTDKNELLNLLKSKAIFLEIIVDAQAMLAICKQNIDSGMVTQSKLDRLEVEYYGQSA